MIFKTVNHDYKYELEKVLRLYMPFKKMYFDKEIEKDKDYILSARENDILSVEICLNGKVIKKEQCLKEPYDDYDRECERIFSVMIYEIMFEFLGYKPSWGILTGIRPAKLLARKTEDYGENEAEKYFKEKMLVSNEKYNLCKACMISEKNIINRSEPRDFSLYISIPFCPTRCNYCSFVSHSVESAKNLIPEYLDLLIKEIKYTAKIAKDLNLNLKTVYIGGGTPTTLSAIQLSRLLETVNTSFQMNNVLEFTVEAGRPDTIDVEKLLAIKNAGVTRISINPQTMNDKVLENIGRKHTSAQTIDAFNLARKVGFDNINMDLIAGLTGDTAKSFNNTLDIITALSPESVTVHTLSVKRSSKLLLSENLLDIADSKLVLNMLENSVKKLENAGLLPYYMYRQGKTVGNFENVGYAKIGFEGLYNVYIMDETHTILACGASAVTKLREPGENNIKRIFNFKYPYEYIKQFDELIVRKNGVDDFYETYCGKY